jgi:hypothetical protein
MTFDDLIELARLCLKQAAATSNPAAAVELRRMADDYQARAAGLGAPTPHTVAIPDTSPQAAPPLQQQQPQPEDGGEGEVPSD